ncbi:hypothetical protein ONZ51_g4634 [Trametes cubensis]|uniref:BZIP domain-containing protein n=1 Tax=Trametes cubensis TaxID=1111947 RepID=A0AAD7XA42_9APHY|nr:hypothetical protein ONZ51_g4634 [Trametes cubensis]
MAPSNLQGLNIVHPIQPPNPYLSDADLLSVPPFPDLNAQLDLWTNLNFQSDEPLVSSRPGDSHKDSLDGKHGLDDSSEDDPERYNDADDDLSRSGIAETQAHENVVMGTVLPPTGVVHPAHPPANGAAAQQLPNFDINSLLAGFGIDPFMAPPPPAPQTALPTNPASTIAQLLSMHAASFRPGPVASAQSVPTTPVQSQPQQSQAPSPINTATTTTTTATKPPVESIEDKSSATPLTAAEDKRRRNTAASARFRLKKKEREAALERKAKELEVRVGELEKECEALRRENGWLKGLVVGVTGAGAVQQSQLQQIQPPSGADSASAGTKRPREEESK